MIEGISRLYALKNTVSDDQAEAAARRRDVLTSWMMAGRASEAAFISYSYASCLLARRTYFVSRGRFQSLNMCCVLFVRCISWDPHFECVVVEVPQMKTAKVKLLPNCSFVLF
jgi:hypothetical protein